MFADLWIPCFSPQPVGLLFISPQHLYSLKWKLKCDRRQEEELTGLTANRYNSLRKMLVLWQYIWRHPTSDSLRNCWYFDSTIGEHLAARINVTPSVIVGTLDSTLGDTEKCNSLRIYGALDSIFGDTWQKRVDVTPTVIVGTLDSTLGDTEKCNSLRIDGALDSIFGDTQQLRLM